MADDKNRIFNGFSQNTFEFLRDLGINNNKAWFEEHREDYVAYVLWPLQRLVQDLGPLMLSIDPLLETKPAVDKTIARIYRDTRFSRDKSPYRSNIWITFRRAGIKDWKEDPCYFFEIFPDWYRFGMGYYTVPKETMDRLRENIEDKPNEFRKIISPILKDGLFIVEGEKYRRILNKDISEDLQVWYQKKELYLTCNRGNDEALLSEELVDDLISGFKLLAPMYNYLWKLK